MTVTARSDRAATHARWIHDADAHVFGTDGFSEAHADPDVPDRSRPARRSDADDVAAMMGIDVPTP